MEKKSKILICIFLLFAGGCEKQRFLNVPFTDLQYVVNGLFAPGEACRIEISRSQYLNDTSEVKNVGNATISLFEDGRLLESLSYSAPNFGQNLGTYQSSFSNFQKGKEYSITIEAEDNTLMMASDFIPTDKVNVQSFVAPVTADTSEKDLNFELTIRESSASKQYFHFLLQERWVEYTISQGDTIFAYNPWFSKSIAPIQDPEGFIPTASEPFRLSAGGRLQGIMLDNENFRAFTRSVSFTARNSVPILSNTFLESRVLLRSVSASYFDYYFSSSQYFRTKSIPLTEPIIISSNITNALGNFSGYYTDTSKIARTFY
jgi:hypothetical protein